MADSDRLKGEDPHISGNIKLILLSREERSASIVQPYLTRVVISTVKDDVDIGIGAGSRTRSCQCLHLVWDGVCMWCKERREGGRGRERERERERERGGKEEEISIAHPNRTCMQKSCVI